MSRPELPPVAHGQLSPIPSGWPIRTASGSGVWRLAPPRARGLARALTVTPAVLVGAGAVGLMVWGGVHPYLFWMLGKGGLAKFGLLTAAGAAAARWSSRLVSWQLRRLAGLHRTVASLRGSRPGSLVRVVGTVRAEQPFAAAVSGQPAVVVHYETRAPHQPPRHQLRGIDFLLDVDASEAVRVAVKDCYFDDRPSLETSTPTDLSVVGAADGGRYWEARLGPGDRVEALGVLVRQVDPALAGGPGRSPPLRLVIQASPRLPLFLRKV
jgi:hypothetical protein